MSPCIDFVHSVSEIELPGNENFFEIIFDTDQLIFALCESMNELINQHECTHTEFQFKQIKHWINIIFNLIRKNSLKLSDEETDKTFSKINIVLLKILMPFTISSNLNPMEEKSLICIHECVKMVLTFQNNELFPNPRLIQTILHILVNFKKGIYYILFFLTLKILMN